jgi:hypothetical protein
MTLQKSKFLLWFLIAAISSQSAGICSGIQTNPKSARADKSGTRAPIKPAPASLSTLDQDVNAPVKDKWALVIGISKFQNPQISLRYAAKDATDFYNYLVTDGGFARDHVKLLTNEKATHTRILSELGDKWLPRVANPDDLVIIYVSSHGSSSDYDVDGDNFIVTYDTEPTDLYTTALDMQELAKIIKHRVHSRRVALFLDACHSGAITPEAKGMSRTPRIDASKIAVGTGQLVICSSKTDQVSWELKNVPNSVFTKYLIDGLRLNGPKTKLGDAFGYMQDKVQETVLRERGELQTPVLRSEWKGDDLVVAVKPVSPRPGMIDDQQSSPESIPAVVTASNRPAVSAPTSLPIVTASSIPVVAAQSKPIVPASSKPAVMVLPTTPTRIPVNQTPIIEHVNNNQTTAVVPATVHFKDQILLLPISRASKETVVPSSGDLWGVVSSPEEFSSLPSILTAEISKKLTAKTGMPVITANYAPSSPREISKLAVRTSCKFVLQVSFESVEWRPGMMSNKYKMALSGNLISGETGIVSDTIAPFETKKSPFKGDMKGGRKFFEEDLAPEAASHLVDAVARDLGK